MNLSVGKVQVTIPTLEFIFKLMLPNRKEVYKLCKVLNNNINHKNHAEDNNR